MPFNEEFKEGILKQINHRFSNRIEVNTIEGFMDGKGTVKLDDAIYKEIRSALIFISDITPIASKDEISNKNKWIANPNVMLELGYALAVKNNQNVIITYNKDRKQAKMSFPFDIQSLRIQPYSIKSDDGFKDLISEIEFILKKFGL